MNNKEITIEICKIMGYNYEVDGDAVMVAKGRSSGNVIYLQSVFDPCRVPGDAFPVIDKFKVSLVWTDYTQSWTAHCGQYEIFGENPLEIAMRVVVVYCEDSEEWRNNNGV